MRARRLMCRTTAAGRIPGWQSYCTWFPIVKYSRIHFFKYYRRINFWLGWKHQSHARDWVSARSFPVGQGSLRSNCAWLSRVCKYYPQDWGWQRAPKLVAAVCICLVKLEREREKREIREKAYIFPNHMPVRMWWRCRLMRECDTSGNRGRKSSLRSRLLII